ncbi:LysR family transcriptional regulator [Nocardiopsis sp. NPDC006198]|uniref:LysR family transcriptional regulator n=1 Tax=Nocardiopsis sp. NPDC006198 TaxID=3154472 RepID=UPI0033ACF6AD
MSIDAINLDLVLAIREQGSIAAAARRLHLSPAAAARRITALENEIGGPLVTRGSRTTTLTPLGERYARWGTEARALWDSLPDHPDDPGTDTVYVAVLGAALGPHGGAILEEVRHRYPSVRLVEMPVTARTIGDPIAGGADIVFGQLLGDEERELGWQTRVTGEWDRAVVVPAWSDYADADRLAPTEVRGPWLYSPAGDRRHEEWMSDTPVAEAPRDIVVDTPWRVAGAVEVSGRPGLHTMMAAPSMRTPGTAWIPLQGRRVKIGVGIRAGEQRPVVLTAFYLAGLCLGAANLDELDA